jgi:putative FmdB family regulatory protein
MPVYEYLCPDCGQAFERYVQRWSEAVACPSCAGLRVEKQLSTFSMAGGGGAAAGSAPAGPRGGGGCCGGGGCGCH